MLIAFVLLLQIESYMYLCYNNFIFFTKALKLAATNRNNKTQFRSINNATFLFFFISIFFYKHNTLQNCHLVFLAISFLYIVNSIFSKVNLQKPNNNTLLLVLPTFAIFLYFIFFLKSLLVFFFFIELYSVMYYFLFLTSYTFSNQTLLKYKNGLLFLLWNNFLTSIFLVLGTFLTIRFCGTTDFYELNLITTSFVPLYIYLIGLFWKLGLPVFHFLKLEIYKYLLRENVFLFSILTTLVNVIILFLTLSQPIFLNTLLLHNWLIVVFIFSILLAIVNLNVTNLLQFFAFSSVFTLTTVLTIYII